MQAPHLFQNENTVPRSHRLRKLCNPALVKVRPWEAPVVEVDLWAAILSINYHWERRKQRFKSRGTISQQRIISLQCLIFCLLGEKKNRKEHLNVLEWPEFGQILVPQLQSQRQPFMLLKVLFILYMHISKLKNSWKSGLSCFGKETFLPAGWMCCVVGSHQWVQAERHPQLLVAQHTPTW